MFITDPDTTPTADTAADPASAAAAAPDPAPTPEPVIDEADGMLAAIAAAEEPKDDEPAAAKPKEGAAPEEEADPTKAKDKPAEADPDAEITAEADKYGLKGKANERFREMAGEIKQMAPIREAMEKAGITDVADLPRQFTLASQGQELIQTVIDTGATPDQFGMTLEYMGAINQAMSGDEAAGERAWAMFIAEGKSLAKALGREFTGLHDPLSDHADLQAEVEAGDVTRARALEIAATRQREANRTAADKTRKQTEQQRDQQTQVQQAETQGRADLNALGDELGAADPHFEAKLPQLIAFRDLVRKAHPPTEWAAELRKLYATIPTPVVATPAAAKPTPGPVRASGPMPTMTPTFDDPLTAMMAGIEAASQ